MERLNKIWPPLAVLLAIVAIWWYAVIATESLIFPTPAQVVRGTMELVEDGSLWEHIGASLMRVGVGFSLAILVAVPMGLWMGRVDGAFRTLNPVFQILRPISPIAWIPVAILWFGVGNASPVFLIFIAAVFPMIVQTAAGVHTIPACGGKLRRIARQAVPPGNRACGAAGDHRRHAHFARRGVAGGGGGGNDRFAFRARIPDHRFAQRGQPL
jgi:ABC-type nitrate/sulfonate/bicarbonate transport system permease component